MNDQPLIVDSRTIDWQPSPAPGIWRKRLEHRGAAESGRVTSLVRFDAGARFPQHGHPDGEEILVLSGVFSDSSGDYPAGSFLLNPEGFAHAPWSDGGCTLLVKLCQYPGASRSHLLLDTNDRKWAPSGIPGIDRKLLYAEDGHPETIALFHLAAGASVPAHDHPGGEEAYVLEGSVEDQHGRLEAGCWARFPAGSRHQPHSAEGATLYVKSGHLA